MPANPRAEYERELAAFMALWNPGIIRSVVQPALYKLLEAHAAMVRADTLLRIDQWMDARVEAERRMKNG